MHQPPRLLTPPPPHPRTGTHVCSRLTGSFRHSASAPGTTAAAGGAQSSRTAARAGGGGNVDPDANAPTPRTGANGGGNNRRAAAATAAVPGAVPPKLSTPRGGEEYGFSADFGSSGAATTSGSTTTEEGFPVEPGRSNSGSSVDNGGDAGNGGGSDRVGTGGGSGGERRGSADSVVTDKETSSHGGDLGAAEDGKHGGPEPTPRAEFGGVLEAAEAALAAATASAGGAPAGDGLDTLPLSHPLLFLGSSSTEMGVGIEQSSEAASSPPSVKGEGSGRHGFGKVLGAVSFSDEPEQEGDPEGATGGVHQDPSFARALAEAAQAEAEIEAAEVADIEAERQRVR